MTHDEKLSKRAEEKYFKEHTTKIKLTPGDIVFNILNYLFFILFTLSCIFPFYYIFIFCSEHDTRFKVSLHERIYEHNWDNRYH